MREANRLAKAKMTLDQAGQVQVHNFDNLPRTERRILNTDKQRIPLLRIKTRRINPTC
ncbi:hypothetical protein RDI58_016236 [Solanum bulbocastanum]|uniref:Uncharacterized protein n=1 Tax=Solanum bulbocastanum TaxID=147425 RepID=A0AAN8TLK0_SOLBU